MKAPHLVMSAALLAGAAALAGCGKPRANHDLAYYQGDVEARQAEVASCASNPAAQSTPDCLAALKAASQAESQRALTYAPPKSRVDNASHL